ncbi:galactose-3-O-sulfotransferase 3-like [Convolutriloba macropyga]|uniref:galactose-3-O-sulfotransferase 3-like n=1 Tax=Convolutriloba macropyga TaxID=536237 RepID=UPI003F526AAE
MTTNTQMQLTVRKVETTLFCISVLVLVALIRNLLETQLDQESGNNHFLRSKAAHPEGETRSLVFVKTVKTGSTTVQNILYRKALHENITVLFPAKKNKRRNPHLFSMLLPIQLSHVHRSALREKDKFLLNHFRMNYGSVNRMVNKSEAVYVTILRDIPDVLESRVSYFNFAKHLTLQSKRCPRREALEFVRHMLRNKKNHLNFTKFGSGVFTKSTLGNGYYFQLQPDLTLSDSRDDLSRVEDTIKTMDKQFDVVMITDQFEESLIVLKNYTSWPLDDFAYVMKMQRKPANCRLKSSLTHSEEKDYRRLAREYLAADERIYQHFKEKLRKQIAQLGKKYVSQKVRQLRDLNKKVAKECQFQKTFEQLSYKPGNLFSNVKVTNKSTLTEEQLQYCSEFILSDRNFCKYLTKIQNLRLKN